MIFKSGELSWEATAPDIHPYTIELTGPGDKLDAFLDSLRSIDIMEVVRSGVSGIARGDKALRQ